MKYYDNACLCLFDYLSARISHKLDVQIYESVCTCYLWLCIGLPLTTIQYLCTSHFVDDVMCSHNGANGSNLSTALCFVKFAR